MLEDTFKLHHDEKILMYVRRHWIFLIADLFRIFILFILPALVIWIFQFMGFIPDFNIFGVTFISLTDILVYMWGIFCWLMVAEKFTDYSLDFWVVTNKRIVESELIKLFNRKLSTLELQDIEDITIQNAGFFSNYFGYGTLAVQTAGTKTEFQAEKIAKPEFVQQTMFDAKLKDEQEKSDFKKQAIERVARETVKQDLEGYIPSDQVIEKNEFDWAHIDEKQKADIRNLQEQIEEIEEKYKTDINEALKTDTTVGR